MLLNIVRSHELMASDADSQRRNQYDTLSKKIALREAC
jgi:hypothetical protein